MTENNQNRLQIMTNNLYIETCVGVGGIKSSFNNYIHFAPCSIHVQDLPNMLMQYMAGIKQVTNTHQIFSFIVTMVYHSNKKIHFVFMFVGAYNKPVNHRRKGTRVQ